MNAAHFAVQHLGLVPYEQTWRLQEGYTDEIARGERPQTLLLLEHPHTYTFGRRGQIQNLLWDEAELSRRGITVQWVDRGGDVTYHGPGQLVGYPLLVLARGGLHAKSESGSPRLPQTDYVGYVRKLEGVIITALAQLGVASKHVKGLTGVWIPPAKMAEPGTLPAKIAAIGVKVDVNGVSRHGFALNVDPDMSYWEGIVGCGLKDYPVTSLAKLLDPVPVMDQVIEAVIAAFEEVFEMRRLS
jgi:lipoate-protein ligase B